MARMDPHCHTKFEVPREKLRPGDVVRLASGGETMTVGGGTDEIVCVWHTDAGKSYRERYPKGALLVKVPTDQELASGSS